MQKSCALKKCKLFKELDAEDSVADLIVDSKNNFNH
jgi:hypothetical protein